MCAVIHHNEPAKQKNYTPLSTEYLCSIIEDRSYKYTCSIHACHFTFCCLPLRLLINSVYHTALRFIISIFHRFVVSYTCCFCFFIVPYKYHTAVVYSTLLLNVNIGPKIQCNRMDNLISTSTHLVFDFFPVPCSVCLQFHFVFAPFSPSRR